MARPKNTDGETRTVRIAFMVSESEEQELRALATAHGFDQYGMFIRSASLGKIPVDRSKIETVNSLSLTAKAGSPMAMGAVPTDIENRLAQLQKRYTQLLNYLDVDQGLLDSIDGDDGDENDENVLPPDVKPTQRMKTDEEWDAEEKLKQAELEKSLPPLTADNFYSATDHLEPWERAIARLNILPAAERKKLDDIGLAKTEAREEAERMAQAGR